MADFRVTCIRKAGSHFDPHERIDGLGGNSPGNWYASEADIIGYINSRTHTFHTMVNGRRADVLVAEHRYRKYLRTENDGYAPNNLLNLPECP